MITGNGRICPGCGAPSQPSDQFCGQCGKPLAKSPAGDKLQDSGSSLDRKHAAEIADAVAEMYDVKRFLASCQADPEKALRRISEVQEIAPALKNGFTLLVFRFVALAQRAINDYEAKGNVIDEQVRSQCEESLSEYVTALKAASTEAEKDILTEIVPNLDRFTMIIEQYAPGRTLQLMGTNIVHGAKPARSTGAGDRSEGQDSRTLWQLMAHGQVRMYMRATQEYLEWVAHDLKLTARFTVQSASIDEYECGSTYAGQMEKRKWERVKGSFFNQPFEADYPEIAPIPFTRHRGAAPPLEQPFVFLKDLRKDRFGKVVDPGNYDRWVLLSPEEYKRFKSRESFRAKLGSFVGVALFWVLVIGGLYLLIAHQGKHRPTSPINRQIPPQGSLPVQPARSRSMKVPVLETCTSAPAWHKCSKRTEFRAGERIFVYAEAWNVNYRGRANVAFDFRVFSPGGTRQVDASNVKCVSAKGNPYCWAWMSFRLFTASALGPYTVRLEVHNHLTGQVGRRTAMFTLLPTTPPPTPAVLARQGTTYTYGRGYFTALGNGQWEEHATNGLYHFREQNQGKDSVWIYLRDGTRNINVRIPVGGGLCGFEYGPLRRQGPWNNLYTVTLSEQNN